MEKYPLRFFTDLEDHSILVRLQEDFYTTGLATQGDVDRKEEVITGYVWFHGDEEMTYFNITFSKHLQKILIDERKKAIDAIDYDIYSMSKETKEASLFLKNIYTVLNDLMIKSRSPDSHLYKYSVVYDELFDLKQSLVDRYQILDSKVHAKPGELISTNIQPKMQWLGQTNQLTTLFFDLMNGFPEKGMKPLLKANKEQVEHLIVTNFLNKEGKSFEYKSTVDKYLDESSGKIPPKAKRIDSKKYNIEE
jgi:hypothetical protein